MSRDEKTKKRKEYEISIKKKIGMITIHYVDNIGGVLLAYALQETIDRFGYECQIIDFDPTPIPSKTRYLVKSIGRRIMRMPLYIRDFRYYFSLFIKNRGDVLPPMHSHGSIGLRKTRFDSFRRKYIKLSEHHYTLSEALKKSSPQYDAYVCGSDQIWNPFMCKNPDQARNEPAYFLDFAPKAKRISYAPSIAIPKIPDKFRTEMAEFIHGIPYLSSREKQGADLIKELTGRNAEVVLDPTLLLNYDQWNHIAIEPDIQGPYILCYFLGEGQVYRDLAIKLGNQTGFRLVVVSRDHRDMEGPNTINCSDAGPAEFLGLVKNASLVCTDSFHGTIFSINFKRPFYVFERPGSFSTASMATRIYSILSLLGLTSRLMKSEMPILEDPLKMDFSKAETMLEGERAKSLRYLEEALKQATGHSGNA